MNLKLKASSLSNTIFVCVIISIFCGCLVLIASYFNLLNKKLYFEEELIERNNSAFNYALSTINDYPFHKNVELDVFNDGIHSYINKKRWGNYDVLICKTIFKNDTLTKQALINEASKPNALALYVSDYDKLLKLSGKTTVIGEAKIPKGRFDRAYLNGRDGNEITLRGKTSESKKVFPKFYKDLTFNYENFEQISLDELDTSNEFVNSFDKPTLVIEVSNIGLLANISLKGNIILKSQTPLKITNTAKLEDIVVDAKELIIEEGFIGNIQIVSKEKITIDSNVKLKYPSSIYVENDLDSVQVEIGEKSWLLGNVVISGKTYSGSLKRKLKISEDATVVGTVYNYGSTQLQGRIFGTIYSDRFVSKTKEKRAENVILNGYINRDSLPANFVELPVLENQKSNYDIIKTF